MGLDITFNIIHKRADELAYLRKANFLVKFFENRGYIVENLVPLKITLEDCKELLDRCNKVLSDHNLAEELLPATEGFFFGSTKYDDYYYDNVQHTQKYLIQSIIPAFENLKEDELITFDIWY